LHTAPYCATTKPFAKNKANEKEKKEKKELGAGTKLFK
jgi:hypothetical protein